MDRHAGFTLMELLTSLTLVAILASLAVPALDRVILDSRRAAALDELVRAAWYARTEALRRGEPVLLCAAGDTDTCVASHEAWTDGWRVAPVHEPGMTLRRGRGAPDPRARLLANRTAFRFEPHDRRSTNGTLAWCDGRGNVAARAVIIAPTGRPRLERGPGALDCVAP
jgi:type IV fimbrial biogenesis protein FimT